MFKLILILTLSSCAFFIKKIENPLVRDPELLKKIPQATNYCPLDKKINFQLVGTNENSQSVYMDLIKNVGMPLDFLDHFALWNLMQMSVRPDQSSATSRFQVLIQQGDKNLYFDFFSEFKDDQYPYLYGIEWVLKKFGKRRTLEQYASILSASLGKKIKISRDFAQFLTKNSGGIKNDPLLSPLYIRGNDILKENETVPSIDYQAILKEYRKTLGQQKIIVNTVLTPFVTEKGSTGSCNYDFNLYDNSIFLIDKAIPVANLYGLSTSKGSFLASSSQKLERTISLKGSPLFQGESKVRSSAVCMIEHDSNKIWAFSNLSRDPGQHLFHLVRYGLSQSKSASDVDRLIKHSRHLFLSDPVRLIIESARSSNDQIENLLKMNLPIYNADRLGNIWAFAQFQEGNRFIIDDRNPGALVCQ